MFNSQRDTESFKEDVSSSSKPILNQPGLWKTLCNWPTRPFPPSCHPCWTLFCDEASEESVGQENSEGPGFPPLNQLPVLPKRCQGLLPYSWWFRFPLGELRGLRRNFPHPLDPFPTTGGQQPADRLLREPPVLSG